MKKILMATSVIATMLMVAWTVGAMLYFMFVVNYHRNAEQKETSEQNHPSNRNPRTSVDCRTTSGLSPDTADLLLARNKPTRIVQREATGRYDGNKLW